MQFINGFTYKSTLAVIAKRNKFKQAWNGATGCRYRMPNNLGMCLIGAFIPDEKYDSLMEGGGLRLFRVYGYLEQLMPLAPDDMVRLQAVHDSKFADNKKDNKELVINFLKEVKEAV